MAQYINKDALIEEIEKRERRLDIDSPFGIGAMAELECLKDTINTLEVKEVDLEKVIEEYFKGWTDDYDNGGAACHYQYVQVNDCKTIAKHFFKLGLKAQKVE